MNRHNIFQSHVSTFNLEAVTMRLKDDWKGFFRDFEAFSKRELTLTEAELGIDRKLLYVWKKQGLLPYSGDSSDKSNNKIWGRFSFIELCWLKMLIEFRKVGLGMEKLKEIKNFFFKKEFLNDFFNVPVSELEKRAPEVMKMSEDLGLFHEGQFVLTEDIRRFLEEIQLSLFSVFLYATMLSRNNFLLYIDGKGHFDVVDLNKVFSDPVAGVAEFHQLLNSESVVFINIKKIIADLSDSHEYFSKKPHFGHKMAETSVNLLRQFFLDDRVKEVSMRISEKGRPNVWITREMQLNDLEKEFRLQSKKGKFCDLVVKMRDGKVQYFEHTEILKL
ncbi:MAG: hypothetical protein HYZ15_03365 [Sphingobacteriales bacterium]|nr:hypothetical protein [Sphingobacteriales bacterium]